MELPTFDADQLALLYVQQYLHEAGYERALSAIESQSGLKFDEDKLTQGSQLMHLVWQQLEGVLAEQEGDAEAARREAEEQLLKAGRGDYPDVVTHTIDKLHPANIITVRLSPVTHRVVTGSGDGQVRCFNPDGTQLWGTTVGAGAALSVDIHSSDDGEQVVAGSMDGSVSIINGDSGAVAAAHRPHAKYVVRVLWYSDGTQVVSASHDQSVAVSKIGDGGEICKLHSVDFPSAVLDCALCGSGGSGLVVGLRGSNYLRILDAGSLQERCAVNMNERGDDHVSFSARHLSLSPCGSFLLVSTDTSRMLVLRVDDWSQVWILHGLAVDQFHQPAAAWHRDNCYIFAAATLGQVYVYNVGSAKVVAKLKCHPGSNVRDLHYSTATNTLVTCSFDKTVKLLTHKE